MAYMPGWFHSQVCLPHCSIVCSFKFGAAAVLICFDTAAYASRHSGCRHLRLDVQDLHWLDGYT